MRPRILVVDDDEAITQQLLWTLSDEYDVMVANDLRTAVRHATIHEPAVSILDLHFPTASDDSDTGIRILEYIKAHIPSSKILAMTADSGDPTLKARFGVDEFLSKPFDTEQLLSAMRRISPRSFDLA